MMTTRSHALVVEDDSVLRAIEYQVLRKMGFEVVTVDCVDKAVRLLDECSFDLLITDIHLGAGRNGIDLVRIAREQGLHLKILVVSGSLHERRARGLDALADGLLDKPFSVADLQARVLHVLDREPAY